jgi:hypothetical protein
MARRVPLFAGALVWLVGTLPGSALAAPPVLTQVVPQSYGYDLVGTGFGTDKTKVQVFEDTVQIPGSVIESVTNDRLKVRSKPKGIVRHKVRVSGQDSAPVSFTHTAAPAPSRRRTLTLPPLQATGHRPEAAPPRALTLSPLSATGHRPEAVPARILTLSPLSAEGYRPGGTP